MRLIELNHLTTYNFSKPVGFGTHNLMLRPTPSPELQILKSQILVNPCASITTWQAQSGNLRDRLVFNRDLSVQTLSIEFALKAIHNPRTLDDIRTCFEFCSPKQPMPNELHSARTLQEDNQILLRPWIESFYRENPRADSLELMCRLNQKISKDISYQGRVTKGTQRPDQTLELGTGSCRDYAWLMIEAARSLGYPARFVSGYIYDESSDSVLLGGRSTHAWAEIYLGGAGWTEFDPTNNLVGSGSLIAHSRTLHYRHAIPVSGSFGWKAGNKPDVIDMHTDVSIMCKLLTNNADLDPVAAPIQQEHVDMAYV